MLPDVVLPAHLEDVGREVGGQVVPDENFDVLLWEPPGPAEEHLVV